MTTKEHLSKHDREIAAIRTLLGQGMRLLVQVQQAQKRTEEAQRRTEMNLQRLERNVEAFVNSLRRGGNGRVKGKLDIE